MQAASYKHSDELYSSQGLGMEHEQVLSTKTKRLEEIQNRTPQLERTKKCAVTEHNFKEAKRMNEIMKQLADEIETLTKDLDDMLRTLTEDKQN